MASLVPLSPVLTRHLRVLNCPLPLNEKWDFGKFQIGVAWIEEEIIRLLSIKNREWLYEVDDKKLWSKNVFEYCKKLDIAIIPTGPVFKLDELHGIYHRLVSRGIEETYLDKMSLFTKKKLDMPHQTSEGVDTQVAAFVQKILDTDKLPPPTPKQALDVIHSRLVPNMKATGGDPSKFTDEKLLRLCATSHLTDLRFHTDKVVTALQMITADPKTDHRLGKVGF